jgi:translation initiation factor 5
LLSLQNLIAIAVVIKYFGIELGSPATIDAKTDRYIVNGEHTAQRLQELLDDFIKKYVLCASCGNPETVIVWPCEVVSWFSF